MPMYNYECECGNWAQDIRKVKDRNQPVQCECGKQMDRSFDVTCRSDAKDQAGGDFQITLDHAELNPVSFNGRRALKRYLKEKGYESSALL